MQGSFWSAFGVSFDGTLSAIDDILHRDEIDLKELLRQEDLIQECKYMNAALIEYLSQHEVVEQLMDFIVMEPPAPNADGTPEDAEDLIRFPYVASELFVCEVVSMLDVLFQYPHLLTKLFSFLDRPAPIDPGSASYFRKVIVVLIQRKYEPLIQYIQSQQNILQKMIRHIGLYSVMELLIMIGWDDGLGQVNDVQWLHAENAIPQLVEMLDHQYESQPEVHVNAARALVDVVVKSPLPVPDSLKQNIDSSDDEEDAPPIAFDLELYTEDALLVTQLMSPDVLARLFECMFSGSQSALTNSLSVVIVLIQRSAALTVHIHNIKQAHSEMLANNPEAAAQAAALEQERADAKALAEGEEQQEDADGENKDKATGADGTSSSSSSSSAKPAKKVILDPDGNPYDDGGIEDELLRQTYMHLPKLTRILKHPVAVCELETQYGKLSPPLGELRKLLVELILVLSRCHNITVNKKLAELNVFADVMDLFCEFKWNNMLHGSVESLIHTVLDMDAEMDDDDDDDSEDGGDGEERRAREAANDVLKHALFGPGRFGQRLVDAYDANTATTEAGGVRLGYMGHVIRLSMFVSHAAEHIALVNAYFNDNPVWQEFARAQGKLEVEVEKQQIILGGHPPALELGGEYGDGQQQQQPGDYGQQQQQQGQEGDQQYQLQQQMMAMNVAGDGGGADGGGGGEGGGDEGNEFSFPPSFGGDPSFDFPGDDDNEDYLTNDVAWDDDDDDDEEEEEDDHEEYPEPTEAHPDDVAAAATTAPVDDAAATPATTADAGGSNTEAVVAVTPASGADEGGGDVDAAAAAAAPAEKKPAADDA